MKYIPFSHLNNICVYVAQNIRNAFDMALLLPMAARCCGEYLDQIKQKRNNKRSV